MRKSDFWPIVVRSLMSIVVVDVVLFLVVGLFCWLIGWRTAYQYGSALVVVSVAIVALGMLSVFGNYTIRGDFEYQYGRSTSQSDIKERNRSDLADVLAAHSFLIHAMLTTVLPALIGTWLQSIEG